MQQPRLPVYHYSHNPCLQIFHKLYRLFKMKSMHYFFKIVYVDCHWIYTVCFFLCITRWLKTKYQISKKRQQCSASSLFKLWKQHKSKQSNLVFGFGFLSTADAKKDFPLTQFWGTLTSGDVSTSYISMFLAMKIIKNWHFLTPLPPTSDYIICEWSLVNCQGQFKK